MNSSNYIHAASQPIHVDEGNTFLVEDACVLWYRDYTSSVICVGCNKLFIRPSNVKKGTAAYYRCKECLSLKSIGKSILYSCSIM